MRRWARGGAGALEEKGLPKGNEPYTISVWLKPDKDLDLGCIVAWGAMGETSRITSLILHKGAGDKIAHACRANDQAVCSSGIVDFHI